MGLVGGAGACLVIDDTALPKKGTRSVGVTRQYCGALGKKANCQPLVSLTLAQGEVPVPVALRRFLHEAWVTDPKQCARAGVPAAAVVPRSKGEIALSASYIQGDSLEEIEESAFLTRICFSRDFNIDLKIYLYWHPKYDIECIRGCLLEFCKTRNEKDLIQGIIQSSTT